MAPGGDAARSKLVYDLGAWAGNVSTSVFIVFVNKMLMKNFGYHYATTLVRGLGCALVHRLEGVRVGRRRGRGLKWAARSAV